MAKGSGGGGRSARGAATSTELADARRKLRNAREAERRANATADRMWASPNVSPQAANSANLRHSNAIDRRINAELDLAALKRKAR